MCERERDCAHLFLSQDHFNCQLLFSCQFSTSLLPLHPNDILCVCVCVCVCVCCCEPSVAVNYTFARSACSRATSDSQLVPTSPSFSFPSSFPASVPRSCLISLCSCFLTLCSSSSRLRLICWRLCRWCLSRSILRENTSDPCPGTRCCSQDVKCRWLHRDLTSLLWMSETEACSPQLSSLCSLFLERESLLSILPASAGLSLCSAMAIWREAEREVNEGVREWGSE